MEEKIKIGEVSLTCYSLKSSSPVIFSKTGCNITSESLYLKNIAGITMLVLGEKEYLVNLINSNNYNAYSETDYKCFFNIPPYIIKQINGLLKNN